MDIKYPEISVVLIGQNGNALNLVGLTKQALKQGGVDKDEIKAFVDDALSGDYNHVLQTCMSWCNVS